MGIALHLWIIWVMTIPVFGILMIATYISFLREDEYEGAQAWLRQRFGHTQWWRALEQALYSR